jgi:glucose-6-phosphate dehydrogenase assembly protein OpcA
MGPFIPAGSTAVPLRHVEDELSRQLKVLQGGDESPVHRACMSNLVIFCDQREHAEEIAGLVPAVVAGHPARVLLVVGEATAADISGVSASALVRPLEAGRQRRSFSEQIALHASAGGVGKLPFAVRALLIGDLPINVWWATQVPPPFAGPLLYDFTENAQQIIYDSLGWVDPARAVAATHSWLQEYERGLNGGRWRVASDLNWRRLKFWRRILKQAFDEAAAPGAVASATELVVEHGPHAVIQAWELVSWLTSQFGWTVQAGNVQEGQEISWQFQAPHGAVRVRIRRLPEGPAEVLTLRLQYLLGGKPGAVVIRVEESRRHIVVLEDAETAPRSANFQAPPLEELVAKQLSDRERDPVFTESMSVAQLLARSVLD